MPIRWQGMLLRARWSAGRWYPSRYTLHIRTTPHNVAWWTTEAAGRVVDDVRLRQFQREQQQATTRRTGKTKYYYGARHSSVEWHEATRGDTCGSSTIPRRRNASQALIPFHVVISSTSVENFSVLRRPSVREPGRAEPPHPSVSIAAQQVSEEIESQRMQLPPAAPVDDIAS